MFILGMNTGQPTFINNNYTYKTTNNSSEYCDIFEELELVRNDELNRRLSFSIPEDNKKLTPKPVPPTPPSTPENKEFTPRITISIPEETDDIIFSLDGFSDVIESNPPSPQSIQTSIDFPKEELLIFLNTDTKIYKIPSRKSKDARKIWRYAKINNVAQINEIESKLLDWAFTYANLKITNKKIEAILWRTHSGCLCSSKWSTFVKWIICATLTV
jgi:hypothetical protein